MAVLEPAGERIEIVKKERHDGSHRHCQKIPMFNVAHFVSDDSIRFVGAQCLQQSSGNYNARILLDSAKSKRVWHCTMNNSDARDRYALPLTQVFQELLIADG